MVEPRPAELSYADALYEGVRQEMRRDASVFVYGLGVDDPKGMYGVVPAASWRPPRLVPGGRRSMDFLVEKYSAESELGIVGDNRP